MARIARASHGRSACRRGRRGLAGWRVYPWPAAKVVCSGLGFTPRTPRTPLT